LPWHKLATKTLSEHHNPGGGFRNPWPSGNGVRSFRQFLRWRLQRWRKPLPPLPAASAFTSAQPNIAYPTAGAAELRVTWVGHSTFLIQIGGYNLLTDPHWSLRSSPVQWLGPARVTPPAVSFDALPPIHAILLSHDHYDHLDSSTIRRIAGAHPAARWFAPIGHAAYLRALGAQHAADLDWWQTAELGNALILEALPVQHWTRRIGSGINQRLWCSWSIRSGSHHVYAGDSGYCPAFAEIAARSAPIDVALLPIGAYEPRWFMEPAHMNPEDSVRAFLDLRARHFVAMHWGTFILTDEPALEPAERIRAAWRERSLAADRLHVLAFGETLQL
jgi:N-acyl-phosphatidylethanolamine-hydrolysing phospholipase D